MCEHCGCRQIEPIAELMDEHLDLLNLGGEIQRQLAAGNRAAAWALLAEFAHDLSHHVDREERGVFQALKDQGDFAAAVVDLEAEHVDFDESLSELGLDDADLAERVADLVAALTLHIDRENLGIFPVATVTLGARGWDTVAAAHERAGADVAHSA